MKFWIVYLLFGIYCCPSNATKCLTRGKYPDNSNVDCRGYTMCFMEDLSFDLLCPEHSIFSHFEKQCTNVTTYQCLPNYNCTDEKNYISSASDCKSYISCIRDLNNITTARLITCPANELFSVTEGVCVNETVYQCNPATETSKVPEVHIDQVKIITRNSSFCIAVHTNTMYFVKLIIMCIIAVILL